MPSSSSTFRSRPSRCGPRGAASRRRRGAASGGRWICQGAAAGALAVGGLTYALIEGPAHGWGPGPLASAVLGAVAFVAFLALERRPEAMMPLALFRLPVFSATNGVTLLLYSAMGCAIFLLMLELQIGVGLSPVRAGLTLLPATVLMLLLSPVTGRWGKERGGRWPMALGAAVAAGGFGLSLLRPGVAWTAVVPGRCSWAWGCRCGGAAHRGGARRGQSRALGHRLGGEQRGGSRRGAAGRGGGALGCRPVRAGAADEPRGTDRGFHRATLLCAGLCVAASVASVILGPVPRKERGPAVATRVRLPERRDAGAGDLLVLVRGDARDTGGPDPLALDLDWQPALHAQLPGHSEQSRPLLGHVLDGLGGQADHRRCPCLPGGDLRSLGAGAVHPFQREEEAAVVHHGDADVPLPLLGLAASGVDDLPGIRQGEGALGSAWTAA